MRWEGRHERHVGRSRGRMRVGRGGLYDNAVVILCLARWDWKNMSVK